MMVAMVVVMMKKAESDRNAKIPETKQELHLKDWLTRDVTNMAAVSKGGNTTKFAS